MLLVTRSPGDRSVRLPSDSPRRAQAGWRAISSGRVAASQTSAATAAIPNPGGRGRSRSVRASTQRQTTGAAQQIPRRRQDGLRLMPGGRRRPGPLGPRLRIGRSAAFAGWDAHRATGGRTATRSVLLADPSSRVSPLPGDGFTHEPDDRASVRHEGGIPLAPTIQVGSPTRRRFHGWASIFASIADPAAAVPAPDPEPPDLNVTIRLVSPRLVDSISHEVYSRRPKLVTTVTATVARPGSSLPPPEPVSRPGTQASQAPAARRNRQVAGLAP
jgi:hypothetical protein